MMPQDSETPIVHPTGRCSFCFSTDEVFLATSDGYVLWCTACGSVEICENGEVKQVYQFGK